MRSRQLASTVFALGAVCAAVAQAQAPYFATQPESERAQWPSSYGTPEFKRLIAGDFDADGSRDVISQSGEEAVLIWDAVYHTTHVRVEDPSVPGNVIDIDVARGAGPGGRDAVATVGTAGLRLFWIAPAPPEGMWTLALETSPIEADDWTDALKVRCGDVDANGAADFVGLDSEGTSVLRRYHGGSSTQSFSVNYTILDLALLQWDSDPALEIALLSDTSVNFYELDGAALGAHDITFDSLGFPGGAITSVKGALRDRIAWVYDTSLGQVLKILRRGGLVDGPYALPSGFHFYSLTTGDAEGDGDVDLMLAQDETYAPYYIESIAPNQPWFGPSSHMGFVDDDLLANTPADNAGCAPLFTDLDGDGRGDLFLAMQQTIATLEESPAHVLLASSVSQELPAPTFLQHGYLCAAAVVPPNPTATSRLFLRLRQPHVNHEPTTIDVYVWLQSVATGNLDENVVSWTRHDVSTFEWSQVEDETFVALDIELPEDSPCFGSGATPAARPVYWFEVHAFKTVDNVVVADWPRRIGAASSYTCDIEAYLTEEGDAAYPLVGAYSMAPDLSGLTPAGECKAETTCNVDGSTPAPLVVNQRRIAQFGPNTWPTLPVQPAPRGAYGYVAVPP